MELDGPTIPSNRRPTQTPQNQIPTHFHHTDLKPIEGFYDKNVFKTIEIPPNPTRTDHFLRPTTDGTRQTDNPSNRRPPQTTQNQIPTHSHHTDPKSLEGFHDKNAFKWMQLQYPPTQLGRTTFCIRQPMESDEPTTLQT